LADDDGHAISYKVLARGTPVVASDGTEVGTVREVLENEREHIFDGLFVDTPAGERWVDAPEIARIAERRVTLAIGGEAVRELPDRDHAGGPQFEVNVRAGKVARFLGGGGWRRR